MDLIDSQIGHLNRILHRLPMTVARYYLSLIDWNDSARDPVFRMYVPFIGETDLSGDSDASGEADNTVISDLWHKYPQIALILPAHRYAMYYRHCFRKRLAGTSDDETANNVAEVAAYINTHSEISNVLISDGGTFVSSNQIIAQHLKHFTPIPHLDLIHFDIRTPVVLPERIYDDHGLLDILKTYTQKRQIYVVTQFNHPKELTNHARKAARTLLDASVIVKDRTVLLKGISDSSYILGALLKDLTKCGVVPYYIFQYCPVSGVENQFQVLLMQDYEIVEGTKSVQNRQGKCIHYATPHVTGKIEILGPVSQNEMLFKYHQAEYAKDYGGVFAGEVTPGQIWLEEPAG